MKLFRKNQRRGMTLAEVLTVVALMTILLAVAMPNLLAESRSIEMSALDGYARSVAVAVQSRLYGMKNAGTSADSEYYFLNTEVAEERTIGTGEEEKKVKLICNFGEKGEAGRKYLLSGALTDTELLEDGKIAVVYDAETADVLEVFYSERKFDAADLFPAASEKFLEDRRIGIYRGEGAPALERNVGLPRFELGWEEGCELALVISMKGTPDESILDSPLGLELYLQFPALNGDDDGKRNTSEEMLIYAEGMFGGDYLASSVSDGLNTIPADYGSGNKYALTLGKIKDNGSQMRFMLDSLVMDRVNWQVKPYLRRQSSDGFVSVASDPLYPRETFNTWVASTQNPYITYWFRQHADIGRNWHDGTISDKLYNMLTGRSGSVTALDYVGIDEVCRIKVKIGLLDAEKTRNDPVNNCIIHEFDETRQMELRSDLRSPYFSALDSSKSRVGLSSMRDLNNLHYVTDSGKTTITEAQLYSDITGNQIYDKLVEIRKALSGKLTGEENADANKTVTDAMNNYRLLEAININSFVSLENFTINGAKPKTASNPEGGSYKIKNVNFPGEKGNTSPEPGGLVEFAKNCNFTNFDIVNSRVWRYLYSTEFLKTDDAGNVVGIEVAPNSSDTPNDGIGGTLVGIAVDCKFQNVRVYIEPNDVFENTHFSTFYVNASVAGGLVGIAISTVEEGCTFVNCSASYRLEDTSYDRLSGKLIYAGGLIGMTIGNVSVQNCYGATQLAAYYSGGLVGATLSSASWSIKGFGEECTGKVEKAPATISNSFAAGQIDRQVRVGAGLIAVVQEGDGLAPVVTNCYSAIWWHILPPVAYGTFRGDNQNYYVWQSRFAVPVTSNVEAFFDSNGDVLSLQEMNCGIACSSTELAGYLKDNWVGTATSTLQYAYNNGMSDANASQKYPFPMPADCTDFFGDWIKTGSYGTAKPENSAAFKFDGYYGVWYCDEDGSQHADASQAISWNGIVNDTSLKFNIYSDAEGKYHFGFEETGGWWLHGANLNVVLNGGLWSGVGADFEYWWARMRSEMGIPGAEVAGVTSVSVTDDGTSYVFSAPAYYDANYNPITGYGFINGKNLSDADAGYDFLPETRVYWDYFGFYCTEDTAKDVYQRCYIRLADVDAGSAKRDGNVVSVNAEEFKEKMNYKILTLSAKNVTVTHDGGYFHVAN